MTERRRIVLGREDFEDAPAVLPNEPLEPAAPRAWADLPPVVRRPPVVVEGAARAVAPAPLLNTPAAGALVAAILGMLLAWAATELSGIADVDARSLSGLHALTGVWTGIIGVVFTGVLVGFDHVLLGAWAEAGRRMARAAVPAFAIGFVAGYLANVVYVELVEWAVRDFEFSEHDPRLYLARALGWAVFGTGAGVAIGLVARSAAKAVNGAIGGCIGGAAGGLAFQLTAVSFASDLFSRALGLVAVGALIAFATRVVETARREAWLHVVAGGMAGKEFILYHPVTRIGSTPECEILLLKDRGVAPRHARIEERDSRRFLFAEPGASVAVNRTPITSHVLRGGDVIQVGSTVLAYAERPTVGSYEPTTQRAPEDQWI